MFVKIRKALSLLSKIDSLENKLNKLDEKIDNQGVLLGRQYAYLLNQKTNKGELTKHEFRVFSQWGDDGIIQHLINNIEIENEIFIEFGVEDYTESNTRFLLINNNWSGLIIDGSSENIKKVQQDKIYWQHNLKAVHSFITKENINSLIKENGLEGNIGLLHIDIDGNDYWVWESIDVVNPDIVILEYNAVFGRERPVTIPYEPNFIRTNAHYSNLYFGASLKALIQLSKKKGYEFVGCNSNGNNAYFIRKDKLKKISPKLLEEGFVNSKFRESRSPEGILSFYSAEERLEEIRGLKVFNVDNQELELL